MISAIETGKLCQQSFQGVGGSLSDITRKELDDIGGKEVFLRIFQKFYERLFEDPLMKVLFNETKEERSAEEHGRLLGGFLLNHVSCESEDDTYYQMRFSEGKGHGLGNAHYRARTCPARGMLRGKGFLKSQGFAWLGHLSLAIDEVLHNTATTKKIKFRTKLLNTMSLSVFEMYGPWVEDC